MSNATTKTVFTVQALVKEVQIHELRIEADSAQEAEALALSEPIDWDSAIPTSNEYASEVEAIIPGQTEEGWAHE